MLGWLLATVGIAALTLVFTETRALLTEGGRLLLYFVIVIASAAIGGTGPALAAALLAGLAINWYFTPPLYTWTIDDAENILALIIFTVAGTGVSLLGVQLGRRSMEARAARAEAEALDAANALRTALLRAVSHDLRTPLSSIKASVTSLREPDVRWSPEEEAEFLAAIDGETDRLNRLVGNLLDMGRLQTGALEPNVVPVAIDDVVSIALAETSGMDGSIVVDIPPDAPLARADAALLERALANVIENAVAAVGDGEQVTVRSRTAPTRVVVEVIDRGPGVDPAMREHMFEPFQRAGDQRRDGVGLGLAVARGLVEAMGGRIEAHDTPGGGLTMRITLPTSDEA